MSMVLYLHAKVLFYVWSSNSFNTKLAADKQQDHMIKNISNYLQGKRDAQKRAAAQEQDSEGEDSGKYQNTMSAKLEMYRKNSKIWDTSNNCHNCPKNRKVWRNIALMHPKDADGMANSVDPDQTASSEAVWSWSALFAETYLSQYIEFVR